MTEDLSKANNNSLSFNMKAIATALLIIVAAANHY